MSNIDLRSEEVQEILGTPPSWIVRYGTTATLVTVVLLGWIGYWLKYPDVVPAQIRITSEQPPTKLVAPGYAYISEIMVQNEDTVKVGQTLLAFKSKAKASDVQYLEDHLLTVKVVTDSSLLAFNPGSDLLLGEIQDAYYEFLGNQEKLRMARSPEYNRLNSRQVQKELSGVRSSIQYDRVKKEKLATQMDLVNQRLRAEEAQMRDNSLPFSTIRNTQEELLALEREMQTIESSIKMKEFQIESINAQISRWRAGSYESQLSASTELKDSFHRLKNAVEDWKKKNLIVSPVAGIAVLNDEKVAEEQYVVENTDLFVILPLENNEPIGRINLKVDSSGKVQVGQRVIVKLKGYPFHEFGALVGEVKRKGRIVSGSSIPIEVRFPRMVTTNNKQIDPTREMTGTADIITGDKRFIERIFENLRGWSESSR